MLVTDVNQGWTSKVNFTDSNDVFVGFDMEQCCCEDFGWYVRKEIDTGDNEDKNVTDFEGYVFDTSFFKEVEFDEPGGESNFAIFKLVKDDCPELYLHLYNHHNGYYGHGFVATIGGEVWLNGGL